MGHVLENAKSGRAKCAKCKKAIAKGELRFGEETTFGDHTSYRWYHLGCGIKACPIEVEQTLAPYEEQAGPLADRDQLVAEIAAAKKKAKPKSFPYGERAPTSRASCIKCGEKIEKAAFRVAVEREVDAGGFVTRSTGYLHPACAAEFTGEPADQLAAAIRGNSLSLEAEELDQLASQL